MSDESSTLSRQIAAIDRILAAVEESSFTFRVRPVAGDYEAMCGPWVATGPTPWKAVAELAAEMQKSRLLNA